MRRLLVSLLALNCCAASSRAQQATAPTTQPDDQPFYRGADISMLPEIERAGGVFRDDAGQPADAIAVLRSHGLNLFRIRLFVDPSHDFNKVYGATQDLPTVRLLAQRVKSSGAALMLDLHYSDTWADGEHQAKPHAWEGQNVDQLEKTVHDYTAFVLSDLRQANASPDIVAIGNEIAGGMLFPEGKVLNAPDDVSRKQWATLSRFLNAGARAVREASTPDHRIAVMIHIHGGGRPRWPQRFFGKLLANPVDFDLVGLSFYPAWGDSLDALATNIRALANALHKPVIVVETGYPWKPEEDVKDQKPMCWPQTPTGQADFVIAIINTMRGSPGGEGFVWWYPEAVPVKGLNIWRQGAEALFDTDGKPLPAMSQFKK